jgi:K+-transporting ATPase ATPase C chain
MRTKTMLRELLTSLRALLALTLLTGAIYPLVVTAAAQALFPHLANGSIVRRGENAVGSSLVGQAFSSPGYFWGRPSATSPPCNAASSSGSNLGPTNPALLDAVKARADALRASDPLNAAPIPVDLLTASGSGLDPHITPAAALWQVPRVARARGLPEERVRALVVTRIEGGNLLGPRRVNVLLLNLALDDLRDG